MAAKEAQHGKGPAPQDKTGDEAGNADAGPGFDRQLERLQAIVGDLEQGELGLEASIERYQEGIELIKRCHATLRGYKQRVEELSAEAEASLAPYDGDPDFPPGAGPRP